MATFVVFVMVAKSTGRQLDTAAAFTALSLISLLASPMNTLIRTIPMLNASMACFSRIQNFLNSDARKDHRLQLYVAGSAEPREASSNSSHMELQLITPETSQAQLYPLMVVRDASFGWNKEKPPSVSEITFTLPRHQFCFIIGPIGSGKSTLLKGLLGETPSTKGFVYNNNTTISYVDQTPWIQVCLSLYLRANPSTLLPLRQPSYSKITNKPVSAVILLTAKIPTTEWFYSE